MKIKIFLISLALMIAGTLIIAAQDGGAQLWLDPEAQSVSAGEVFSVAVRVGDAVGIYGGSFKLIYDPAALEVVIDENVVVTPGDFFGGQPGFTLKNSVDVEAGVVEYALTLTQPAQPVDGEGVLGTVRFRALTAGPVDITPDEALLLAPEFTQVEGRTIAQRIAQITPATQPLTVVALDAVAPAQSVVIDPPAEPAIVSAPPIAEPVVVSLAPPMATMPVGRPPLALLIGGGLFLIGLGLFATSIGAYVGLRRQFSPVARRESLSW